MNNDKPIQGRCRILLVDDDSHAHANKLLEAMGCEVLAERSGLSWMARLITEVRQAPIHGVLLNIQMPHVEETILSELRCAYPDIPLMVMAEAGQIDKLREAVMRGAREYLVKPFDGELFQKKCRRIFQWPQAIVP